MIKSGALAAARPPRTEEVCRSNLNAPARSFVTRGEPGMKGIIAVSDSLSDYRDMLEEEGYEVVSLEEGLDIADAVLISGMDRDHSGISAIDTEVPVLDVTGRRPDEVLRTLEERLELL